MTLSEFHERVTALAAAAQYVGLSNDSVKLSMQVTDGEVDAQYYNDVHVKVVAALVSTQYAVKRHLDSLHP